MLAGELHEYRRSIRGEGIGGGERIGAGGRTQCRAGAIMRHLHAVLQGSRRRGSRQADGRVVSALPARRGLHHLSVAAAELSHVLLSMDARARAGGRMEAGAGEICAGPERRRPPAHRLGRSGLPDRVAAVPLLRKPQAMGRGGGATMARFAPRRRDDRQARTTSRYLRSIRRRANRHSCRTSMRAPITCAPSPSTRAAASSSRRASSRSPCARKPASAASRRPRRLPHWRRRQACLRAQVRRRYRQGDAVLERDGDAGVALLRHIPGVCSGDQQTPSLPEGEGAERSEAGGGNRSTRGNPHPTSAGPAGVGHSPASEEGCSKLRLRVTRPSLRM
jgi:hypothetical protein